MPRVVLNEPADDFEVRADHVGEEVLRNGTVTGDWFESVHQALLAKSLTLLVGPRGCGKTHMMRYTWLQCIEDETLPLAVYVSFNRYLRLEPLLKSRSDAAYLFNTWVFGRIAIALYEVVGRLTDASTNLEGIVGLPLKSIEDIVSRLERGLDLSLEDERIAERLTVEGTVKAIRAGSSLAGRKRAIVLLDDAALTLTPEFLVEFFDVVRALKQSDIGPKCSVYPGSTEYGPRFHATHEGRMVSVWLPIDHPKYLEIMGGIAERRYAEGYNSVSKDTNEALMYAAFGVPRAYLGLLRNMSTETDRNAASSLNRVIQEHRDAKLDEYRTLEKKLPRFETILRTGAEFFQNAVEAVRAANEETLEKRAEKQLLLGIEAADFSALTSRMIRFLVEVGLLHENSQVSHGTDRTYRRFTPHLAALMAVRAFSGKSRSSTAATLIDGLRRKSTKHPVRRKLNTLLPANAISGLKIDLPSCQNCGTARVSEGQKFCMNCGSQLSDPSTFTTLMSVPIQEVANLTTWKRDKLVEHGIKTIRDLLVYQDPGTELRKIHRVGIRRAEQIVSGVESYVDEYLS